MPGREEAQFSLRGATERDSPDGGHILAIGRENSADHIRLSAIELFWLRVTIGDYLTGLSGLDRQELTAETARLRERRGLSDLDGVP